MLPINKYQFNNVPLMKTTNKNSIRDVSYPRISSFFLAISEGILENLCNQ